MAQTDEFEELREDYAEKERARHRRRMQKLWAGIKDVPGAITCEWLQPPDNEVGRATIAFGQEVYEIVTDSTLIERDGRRVYADPFFAKHGGRDKDAHRRVVEAYALWKWHTARGTPVDERDNLLTEPGFEPPKFRWTTKVAKAA